MEAFEVGKFYRRRDKRKALYMGENLFVSAGGRRRHVFASADCEYSTDFRGLLFGEGGGPSGADIIGPWLDPLAKVKRPMTRTEIAALGFVWVRRKNVGDNTCLVSIKGIGRRVVYLSIPFVGQIAFEFEELAETFEYARDGVEWLPFEVEE